MHELVLWAGFLGAWLLVVGPVYQAVLELREEDIESDRIRASMREVPRPEPTSPWLLLVPPVWWWVRHRRRDAFQQQVMAHISDEDFEAFNSFMDKARGWLFVALGGLLIAAKETWELIEGHEWPGWLFGALVVLGLAVAWGHAVASVRSATRRREEREALRGDGQRSAT